MEAKAEKSDHRRPLSAGDRNRKLVLNASAFLLLLTLHLAIVFRSEFKRPWLIVGALLLHLAQTTLGIVYFDSIRSLLVERRSTALEMLFSALSFATMSLTWLAEASDEVSFVIFCVFTAWGGMFELALGIASHLQIASIFSISALFFVTAMVKKGCLVCAWLYLIPIFLVIGMIWWRRSFSPEAVEK